MLLNETQVKMKKAVYFAYQASFPYQLIGFLPLISDNNKYYAMKLFEEIDPAIREDLIARNIWSDYNKEKITHVSPVFGCLDLDFISELEYEALKEKSWIDEGKVQRKQKRTLSDQQIENILTHKETHPYILFFHGCDDGQSFMRFKSEQAAFNFLEMVETFDDVLESENIVFI